MLLAAKIQKQKDAESEVQKQQPQKHVVIDPKYVKDDEMSQTQAIEQRRLQTISDQIDECLLRTQRVEQHWNASMQQILHMLSQRIPVDDGTRKSYV